MAGDSPGRKRVRSSERKKIRIGIDETDSSRGGCTTYIAYRLSLELNIVSPPRLIRLNPNVPWKTRGNGGLALEIETDDPDRVWDIVLSTVEELRDPEEDTGVVMVEESKRYLLHQRYLKALTEVLQEPPVGTAMKYYGRKSARGLIGALAAIGFFGVHTYELLTYRIGARKIDRRSVWDFELMTKRTFGNVSPHPIIVPHGNDPVLYGIRGTDPRELLSGLNIIRSSKYEGYALFLTNQGTDAHMIYRKIEELKPHTPAYVEGIVSKDPKFYGSHVYLEISDDTGSIEVFFYRQTGFLRHIAASLKKGDRIGILGGVRPPEEGRDKTLNAEKLRVFKLVERKKVMNPRCPVCGARLKSAGKDKGWKCKRCGWRGMLPREEILEEPKITTGVYVGEPDSRRHLLRPPRVIPVNEPLWKQVDRRPKKLVRCFTYGWRSTLLDR